MTQRICHFLLLLGGGGDCGEDTGCMVGAGPGFRFFLICLQITMNIKVLNSIKTIGHLASVERLS